MREIFYFLAFNGDHSYLQRKADRINSLGLSLTHEVNDFFLYFELLNQSRHYFRQAKNNFSEEDKVLLSVLGLSYEDQGLNSFGQIRYQWRRQQHEVCQSSGAVLSALFCSERQTTHVGVFA